MTRSATRGMKSDRLDDGTLVLTIPVHHTVYETDFDDAHYWSFNDRTYMREADALKAAAEFSAMMLESHCLKVVTPIYTSRTPYPSEW